MKNILEFPSVKRFLEALGKDIEAYLGKDEAAIVYLRPDGAFYGTGLHEWLLKKKKKVVLLSMDDDANDLEEAKVKGKKVLLVDNDIVTGKGYKRAMEAMRTRRKRLNIKDVKFAAYFDRVGLADFFVEKYSAEAIWHMDEINALDLKIMKLLAENGRTSLSEIAQQTNLSSVSVKHRIDRLLGEKILNIQGSLNIDRFYTMSAHVQIEVSEEAVGELVEKLEKCQEVYHIAKKISGGHNLMVGILAHNLQNIEEFVQQKIKATPGVRNVDVYLGDLPILPKTLPPQL